MTFGLRNASLFLSCWIYSMANVREGFDPLLYICPFSWWCLDSTRLSYWCEDMAIQQKIGGNSSFFVCLQLYCILKGNVVLLQVCYIIFNIWALIQLCTYKRREGVLNFRCSMWFLWNMLFLFKIQNFVQKYTSSLKNGVSLEN